MAEVVPKALILGHSFIRHLKSDLQGSYTFSGQKFKDFSRTFQEISRTFFNDNFTSEPLKKSVSVNIYVFMVFSLP